MIFNWIRKKRIKYAFKFGKLEHKAGRLLGLYLFVCCCVSYFTPKYAFFYFSGAFIIWLIYILSHTFEKKLFGKYGPRTGWK